MGLLLLLPTTEQQQQQQHRQQSTLSLYQSTTTTVMKILFALLLASCLLAVAHADTAVANTVVVGTTATKEVEPVIVGKTIVAASPSPAAVLAEAIIYNQQPVAFEVLVSAGDALRPFSYRLW